MKNIRSLGIIIKKKAPQVGLALKDLLAIAKSRKRKIFLEENCKAVPGVSFENDKHISWVARSKMKSVCDLIIVLGGDGTLLSAAKAVAGSDIPILGVNLGTLGFLTEVTRSEAPNLLRKILRGGKIRVSRRVLLKVDVTRRGKKVFQGTVLNDAVISKGSIARMITVCIQSGSRLINRFRADGIILSTPTGSTAYSLATGGPIVEPSIPAFILSPICPHSLSQRPLVVPQNQKLKLWVEGEASTVILTLDGQEYFALKPGDVVSAQKNRGPELAILGPLNRDFYGLLQEKLKFG